MLPKRNLLDQLLGCLPDRVWIAMEWLTKRVLLLLFLCLPIVFASLEEAVATWPVQPGGDCVRVMGADGAAEWRRVVCFGGEFGAHWRDEFVQLLPYVAEKCKPMADQQAKQECYDRKSRRTENVGKHILIFAIALWIGAVFL